MLTKYRMEASLHNDEPLCGPFPIFSMHPEFGEFTLGETFDRIIILLESNRGKLFPGIKENIYINKVQCKSVILSVCHSVCSTLETLFLKLFAKFFFVF